MFYFKLFVLIYAYWCPTRFPYQMMFVSFNSDMTGVKCVAEAATPLGYLMLSPVSSRIRGARSLVFCAMFLDRCLFFCPCSFGHIVCPSIYGFCDDHFGIFKLFL
jgi:hypothetical protein